MRIQVTGGGDGRWCTNFIGKVFDVEKNNIGWTLINTPENEAIIKQVFDGKKRDELLRRLKNTGKGMRLGVNQKHAVELTNNNNKDYSSLLSKEW
jgi:hypothetical protein